MPSSSGRQAVHASAADSASQIKPAYNKYKCGNGSCCGYAKNRAVPNCQCAGTPTAAACSLALQLCRSPSDVQREYLRQWKEVTARDGTIQPQTILSTLWFVPVWFKYNATPYILRYLVYCVWTVIKAAYFRWHKAMVLRGAPRYRPRKHNAYRGSGLHWRRSNVHSALTCTRPVSIGLHSASLL